MIWHQLKVLDDGLTLIYRFEMKELTGVATRRTTIPANADHPRILPVSYILKPLYDLLVEEDGSYDNLERRTVYVVRGCCCITDSIGQPTTHSLHRTVAYHLMSAKIRSSPYLDLLAMRLTIFPESALTFFSSLSPSFLSSIFSLLAMTPEASLRRRALS